MHVDLLDIRLENLGTLKDGRQFEWESTGAGEPMIWIEGGPGFPAHLGRPDAALLGERFRVHLVNAPGCGRSSPPVTLDEYDLTGHVQFFDQVREALGLERVALAGHSWGGLVAIAWAGTRPDIVSRLLVIDGYGGGATVPSSAAERERDLALDRVRDRPWFASARNALDAAGTLSDPTEQDLVDTFAPAWPLYFADPDATAAREHIKRLQRELRFNVAVEQVWDSRFEDRDYLELARQITAPTLIVVGEHDFICGPVWSWPIHRAIRGSRREVIRDAGHMPHYEAPDAFRTILRSWLDATA